MYTLILYIYIQTFSKGDYPAMVNAGQYETETACNIAGQRSRQALPVIGTLQFICLKNK
jgi:hypothetical protein